MGYTVKVPGSCGELVQGYINNSNFLISCPIDIYSKVTVNINYTNDKIMIKRGKYKTKKALEILKDYYNFKKIGFKVRINSNFPKAKGLGSSTADMSAALIAAIKELNIELEFDIIKEILLKVEPSDATFLEGINLFDHLKGTIVQFLGSIDPIPLLVFDYGGEINTLDFNTRKDLKKLNEGKRQQVKKAYKLIKTGIETNDKRLIGNGATISSLANQSILNKEGLEYLIRALKAKKGFLGLNTAHSGTVIGIMVSKRDYFENVINLIDEIAPEIKLIFKTKVVNGGYKIVNDGG